MTNRNDLLAQSTQLITELSISHIVKYPSSYSTNDNEKRYPLILTLHGHGRNEKDLIGLSEHLQDDLLWISARGPVLYGKTGYDWYQLPPTPEKIASTLNTIHTFIKELIANYPIDASKVFLLGFSQGSMISLSYALAYPKSITGVIAQSGAIPSSIGLDIDFNGLKGKPIVITHGLDDPMMPINRARKTRDALINLGANLDYNEFQMGHTISNESLLTIKKWLEKQL